MVNNKEKKEREREGGREIAKRQGKMSQRSQIYILVNEVKMEWRTRELMATKRMRSHYFRSEKDISQFDLKLC